jgi:hypothetical protein
LWFEKAYVDRRNYLAAKSVLEGLDNTGVTELGKWLEAISLPWYDGAHEQSLPLVDAQVQYCFHSPCKGKIATVRASGNPSVERGHPVRGTPVELVQQVLQALGVGYEFTGITIQAIHSGIAPQNPFLFVRSDRALLYPYRAIALHFLRVDFSSSLLWDIMQWSDISMVRHLRLLECQSLVDSYQRFMMCSAFPLETYTQDIWVTDMNPFTGASDNTEGFLASIHGLKILRIAVGMDWKLYFIKMLQNHAT